LYTILATTIILIDFIKHVVKVKKNLVMPLFAVKVGVPASPPTGYLRPATSNPADSFEIDVSKSNWY
jgi:hypothetical protein